MKDHGPVTILDVLDDGVLAGALRSVSRRKGSPGVDGVRGEMLEEYWKENEEYVRKRLLHGTYRPNPVFSVKIPKPDSKEPRRIEIPCAVDRMLQTALLAVLQPCLELTFLPASYAFRKKGGCHRALKACLRELTNGALWVIDLDIRHFFDKVDHDILLSIVRRTIRDKRLLLMIAAYVHVDVKSRNVTYRKRRGLSQGGPLSPLLANLYLNELDLFLAKIQARYVRYADDILLFCSTKAQAEQLLGRIRDYLKEYLHLSINKEKTKIAHPWEIRYLGYSFLPVIQETSPDLAPAESVLTYSLALPAKTETRMLQRMEHNIRRSLPLSRKSKRKRAVKPSALWDRLGGFNRGWIQYFRKADPSAMLRFLCEAEQYQVAFLTKELYGLQKEDLERILCSLYTCRAFSTLTGWYVLRSLHGESFEERRQQDIMANKYSFWRSGSFYPSRTALYKTWGTFAVQPFFANRENGEEPHDFKVVQSDLPHLHTPVPPLSKTELCALGILAAGKNMTAHQLAAFLKMKSVCLSMPEIQEMLQHFVAEGLLEKASLYAAKHHCPRKFCFLPPKAFEDPPSPSVSYRVFGRGKRLLRNIGAPVDNRIFYGTEEDRSVQTARFYMETVLYNQIILRCMLLCPGFRYYEICSVYNIPTQGKVYVPLLIESGEESYFFWHLDTDTADAFETAIHNWELFYKYRRSCTLVLVVSSDIVMQMAQVQLCRRQLPPCSGAVFLSEAAAWFDPSICRSGGLPLLPARQDDPVMEPPPFIP